MKVAPYEALHGVADILYTDVPSILMVFMTGIKGTKVWHLYQTTTIEVKKIRWQHFTMNVVEPAVVVGAVVAVVL